MSESTSKGKTLQIQPNHKMIGDDYIIHIKEHLSPLWSEGFEGLIVSYTEFGETILSGLMVDQTALHGLLARIRDSNLTLISVRQIDSKDGKKEGSDE